MMRLVLKAKSPLGETAIRRLLGRDRRMQVEVLSEKPLIASYVIKDLRTRVAVKSGMLDLKAAAIQTMQNVAPECESVKDYEVEFKDAA